MINSETSVSYDARHNKWKFSNQRNISEISQTVYYKRILRNTSDRQEWLEI